MRQRRRQQQVQPGRSGRVRLAVRRARSPPLRGSRLGTIHADGGKAAGKYRYGAVYIPEGSPGLAFHSNGSGYMPVPGDLVIYNTTPSNGFGHVSIVDAVSGSQVQVVEQNANWTARSVLTLNGSSISGGVRGLAHSPNNTSQVPTPPRPIPNPSPSPGYHTGRQVKVDGHASGGVSGHAGPSNADAAGPTRPMNSAIWIVCYVNGQSIAGPYGSSTIWDLSDDGFFYTDAWLYTGTNAAAVPACRPRTVQVDKHATGGVSGHRGPDNSYAAGPVHAPGATVTIYCFVDGQPIGGPYGTSTIWDLSNDGFYHTDAWLYTGTNSAAVPHC